MNPFHRAAFVLALATGVAALPFGPVAVAAQGTVTQSAPAFVANTGSATSVTFTLSAAPMSPGDLLRVVLSGPASTTVTSASAPDVSGSSVTATFDLRGIAPGLYGVTVEDLSGGNVDSFTCASCLRVLATPPTVSAVSPAVRGAGAQAATFTVTGTNLFNGVTVRFLAAGVNDATILYPATGSLAVSSDQRTVSGLLAVTAGAVPGTRDVEVTNTDGQRAVCQACLTITPAPSFVSLSPAVAGQGAVARSLALTGADFQPSMTAAFFAPASTTDNGGVTVTAFNVAGTGTATITANVADLSDTANVTRDLLLTNPDGGQTRIANALTVTPEPRVTSLTPSTLDGGSSGEGLTVAGTGLAGDTTFAFSGTGVTVGGWTAQSATAGVLDVTVAPGSTTDGRTLTVVNADGGRSTSATVLTVGPTPTVTSVSPPALGRGAAGRSITVTGTNFDTGGIALTIPGVTLSNVVPTSATTITATASVPGTADLGFHDVTVQNTAAGRRGVATCGTCFSVDTFAVDSVTPNAVLNSATYLLDVTGSNLPAGKTISASLTRNVARAGQDPVTFDGVVDGDGTRFTGTADLRAAAPGAYTLRLIDGTDVGTCTCTFTVVAESSPVLTSVSPSSVPQGASAKELTLKGSGFTRGADVAFGTGITKAGDVTFVDTTTLTVPVNVAPDATPGAVAVTVKIPSSGADTEATCAACLSVTRRPTVTATNRPARGQGAPAIGVTITGTEFQPGATVSAGDGVIVSNVVRASATSMSFTLAVAEDAEPGGRAITVTNPDAGEGTCLCFAVTARPLATAVTPDTGGQGRSGVPVTLTGTGFQSGATVSFGSDVGVSNVTVNGGSLSATLDLTNAALGEHAVSVTNADGGSSPCTCEYTVHLVPSVTAVAPASRGAGALTQSVTVTGAHFAESATVAFADQGITVVDSDRIDATRIDAVISIAHDVAPGARSVTVTNLATGQSGSCASCFTVNAAPSFAQQQGDRVVQRNRQNVTMTFAGSGFTTGPVTVLLGDGITVDSASATSPTSVTVTFDVSNAAALGAHDVTVVNADGGRGTCTGCLTVTTPRVFTFSTDATPRSGAAQTVTLTAHVSSEPGSPADTSYTGVPVLSSSGDGRFARGTCSAASSGVSTCSNVVFGDLGATVLNASGAGADSDLGGSLPVVVEPVSLAFSSAPSTASLNRATSFTVRPVAGVSGAAIGDYAAARTAHVTGHSPSTVPLSCGGAVCTFSLTFTSTGRKTVRVSDASTPPATTPTIAVNVPVPTSIKDFRVSASRLVAGQSLTMRGTLRDSSGRPLGGQPVRIYVTGGGFRSWVLWQRVTTASNGTFAKTAKVTRSRVVKAVYVPPSATYARADSATRTVYVATKVVVTSPKSGSRVTAGRTFTIRGYTYPAKPGTTAYLFWRRSDGRTVLLRTARIGSDGRFALSRSLSRGTYRLQVGVPATTGNTAGRSAWFTLYVV